MARIALISRQLHEEVIALARSLAAQRNDVRILTSQDQTIPVGFEIPLMTPFSTWSLLEGTKLFPHLLASLPDVLHFVFTSKDEQPSAAEILLSGLFSGLPRRAVTCSFFYAPREASATRLRLFLRNCHAVTWGSHVHLLQAKRLHLLSRKNLTDVMPPLATNFGEEEVSISADLQRLTSTLKEYWVVPGSAEDFFLGERTRNWGEENKSSFLFLQARARVPREWTSRIAFLPELSSSERIHVLRQSIGLVTAYHEYSLLELQTFYQWARQASIPLLISAEQNHLFPGLVRENKTGWVIREGSQSWDEIHRRRRNLDLSQYLDENPPFSLVDSATNQLNRLFAQARATRG